MNDDDLDLRGAFARGTQPADPRLAARVRSAIADEAEAPRARGMWLAGAAAAAVAVAIVAVLLATSGPARGPAGLLLPAGSPTPQASATTAPEASPTPSRIEPTPTATPAVDLYRCSSHAGGGPGRAAVVGVRVGSQTTYDRLVIEFNGPVPQYEVLLQPNPRFVLDPSGREVTLQGSAGVLVRVRNATPSGSYSGATDYRPGYPVLAEARQVSDFEGVFSWGLGVAGAACFKDSVLTAPDRLVIDVVRQSGS